MSSLIIGDPASIELRDKGRLDAERMEEKQFLEELQEKVECPDCPFDSSYTDDCEGPKIEEFLHGRVTWKCPAEDCPCCDEPMHIPTFTTDLDGIVLKGAA